jgi:hypothetical protein
MDALWGVTEKVLTPDEITRMTSAEAFLLATGFYLHDIGMAYAATAEGLARIRSLPAYTSALSLMKGKSTSSTDIDARAVAFAVRSMHAEAAIDFATTPIPGTDIYLFEPRVMREAWATTCGQLAASHHWNLDRVESEFGILQSTALPEGREGDLGYVAAVLRLVDYAHINRDRAPTLERAFRLQIQDDSLVHWLAQEKIDGPARDGGYLVYRASAPIADISAWWLYFDMLRGLDAEIRTVKRYLERRKSSDGRFSLEGVAGAESPAAASIYIRTSGFMPIEVNIRTGSIERLVQLLAGESLYGKDPMAAVRELIQNARDAVALKEQAATTEYDKAALSLPIRVALKTGDAPTLEVADWGIGMTAKVMTDYLITLASDYWNTQFHIDFPDLKGFEPAGKFGIGFLSVFMLGEQVTVESNRQGGQRCELKLSGVGRRGEMRTVASISGSGTAVRIKLRPDVVASLLQLVEKVKIYAPMLRNPIEVSVNDETTTIPPKWLFNLSAADLRAWTLGAARTLSKVRDTFQFSYDVYLSREMFHFGFGRPNEDQPLPWKSSCPEYVTDRVRLVASFEGVSVLCLKGLALQQIRTPGFVGIIDVDNATPDASRNRALTADVGDILTRAKSHIRESVVKNLNSLANTFVLNELSFAAECAATYGRETLVQSSLPWISLIQRPGDVRQLTPAQYLSTVKGAQSIFMVYGTGPWTAIRKWSAATASKSAKEIGLVLDDDHDRFRVRYLTGDEEVIGTLKEVFPECEESNLFGTILGLTSEAWQVNTKYLIEQADWHHSGGTLWGRLTRP